MSQENNDVVRILCTFCSHRSFILERHVHEDEFHKFCEVCDIYARHRVIPVPEVPN